MDYSTLPSIPTLGPVIQGSTRPAWVLTVKQSDNSALNLTGATYTGKLARESATTTAKTLTVGSYATTTAASGIFTYSPVAADVDTPGVWIMQTIITLSSQTYYVWVRIPILPSY